MRSNLHWYTTDREKKRYTYQMTVVGAMISTKGIVCVSDGRVCEHDGTIRTDDQVKIFQLSPYCLVLPCNGASDNIEFIMETLCNIYTDTGVWTLDAVASYFVKYCDNHVILDDPAKTPIFILAGYNYQGKELVPGVIEVRHIDGKWITCKSTIDDRYMVEGGDPDVISLHINENLSQDAVLPSKAVELLLNAVALGEIARPEYVGGRTSVWTILPNASVVKLEEEQVKLLKDRYNKGMGKKLFKRLIKKASQPVPKEQGR